MCVSVSELNYSANDFCADRGFCSTKMYSDETHMHVLISIPIKKIIENLLCRQYFQSSVSFVPSSPPNSDGHTHTQTPPYFLKIRYKP